MNHKITYNYFLSPSQPVIDRFLSSLRQFFNRRIQLANAIESSLVNIELNFSFYF